MKKKKHKTAEFINEVVDESIELFKRRVEWQGEAYKEAVEEGWFKYILIGAGVAGASLLTHGLIEENRLTTGMGAGMLTMDALYSTTIYLNPIRLYQDWKKKRI